MRPTLRAVLGCAAALTTLLTGATAASAAPATPVVSVRAGHGTVQLSWTGGGTAGAVVRALEGTTPPAATTDGRDVPVSGSTATDTGLVDGTPQTYAVWALDADGSVSERPATATALPGPPAPSTLRLRPSTTLLPAGRSLTLAGRLYETATGRPLGGVPVEVHARVGGTTTTARIATVTTRGDGLAFHTLVPRVSQEYSLRFAGSTFDAASSSTKQVVRLLPRTSARFAPGAVLRGQSTTLTGSIVPAYQGARVVLQRSTGSGWASVRTMATSSDGRFTTTLTPTASATWRALLVGTYAYDPAASAPLALRVDVRDLRLGSSGPDVLAVEQALWQQGRADVGPVDGVFDRDTLHGVIAFQKSQGLARTGVFSAPTRTRLAGHVQRPPRHAVAGRSVEVDLSQQVLRLFENGRLARLADISSGNGEVYTSMGVTRRAITPTGRFSITRKINGVRVSHLGELYRPAYFVGGYAIHGSPSVPTYPASHGCVRVTNNQMDRLYPLLAVGTPVAVYAR